jgi:hypothetical protein
MVTTIIKSGIWLHKSLSSYPSTTTTTKTQVYISDDQPKLSNYHTTKILPILIKETDDTSSTVSSKSHKQTMSTTIPNTTPAAKSSVETTLFTKSTQITPLESKNISSKLGQHTTTIITPTTANQKITSSVVPHFFILQTGSTTHRSPSIELKKKQSK